MPSKNSAFKLKIPEPKKQESADDDGMLQAKRFKKQERKQQFKLPIKNSSGIAIKKGVSSIGSSLSDFQAFSLQDYQSDTAKP